MRAERALTARDFVQSPMPHVKSDEVIDVVVMDFAMPDFRELHAIRS